MPQSPLSLSKTVWGRIRPNCGIGACSRAMVAILRLLIGALRNCIMSRGRLDAKSHSYVRPRPSELVIGYGSGDG